jgi:preprotein translocase subunit SecF
VFDIIGKKRWFFAFSLLITIPGLLFILLTPITNGAEGLKFSIDYTGGTEWSVKFKDPGVTAEQVRSELVSLGQDDASVTRTGQGFIDIRMSKLDLRDIPTPTAVPTASSAKCEIRRGGAQRETECEPGAMSFATGALPLRLPVWIEVL